MLVNRLHHRMETSLLRNEADLAPVQLHDAEIVPFWETVPSPDPTPFEHAVQSENLALETFKRDFDAFLGKDRQLKKVFEFHCDGTPVRRKIIRMGREFGECRLICDLLGIQIGGES